MLRITTDITERAAILILEGRLAGVWVSELQRSWDAVRTIRPGQSICIDMRGLMFVDPAGKQLLADMYECGADLVASGCLMKGVVQDIYTTGMRRTIASGVEQSEDKRRKP
ncbi:hypothetical protein [Nitrospira sp. Nam74]